MKNTVPGPAGHPTAVAEYFRSADVPSFGQSGPLKPSSGNQLTYEFKNKDEFPNREAGLKARVLMAGQISK